MPVRLRAEPLACGELDDRQQLAPALRRDGLFFVGIDVIGGLLTEINVTSPTGLQEIDALEGTRLEARVIDAAERLARAPDEGAQRVESHKR